jgi:hypothetical protein
MFHSQRPQEALNLLVTEECYLAHFYMALYTFLHNLLNVLVQIANKMGLQKKLWTDFLEDTEGSLDISQSYGPPRPVILYLKLSANSNMNLLSPLDVLLCFNTRSKYRTRCSSGSQQATIAYNKDIQWISVYAVHKEPLFVCCPASCYGWQV